MYIIGWLNVTSICNLKMDLALKLSKRRHCKLLKFSRSDGMYDSVGCWWSRGNGKCSDLSSNCLHWSSSCWKCEELGAEIEPWRLKRFGQYTCMREDCSMASFDNSISSLSLITSSTIWNKNCFEKIIKESWSHHFRY